MSFSFTKQPEWAEIRRIARSRLPFRVAATEYTSTGPKRVFYEIVRLSLRVSARRKDHLKRHVASFNIVGWTGQNRIVGVGRFEMVVIPWEHVSAEAYQRASNRLYRLRRRWNLGTVAGAYLNKPLQGLGIGLLAYTLALRWAHAHDALLTPSRELNGSTSFRAMRVWKALKRRHPSEGPFVAWIGPIR